MRRLFLAWCALLLLPGLCQAITVTVAWDYTDSGQDGFQLLRCLGAGTSDCTPTAALSLSLGPTVRQAADSTPAGGNHYCYSVIATLTGQDPSPASNVLCVDIPVSGVATHLLYSTPPQASTVVNQSINTIVVQALDGFNQLVTSFTSNVTVQLGTPSQVAIPQSQLIFVSVDSEETAQEPDAGVNAIDGNPSTFWHTHYFPTADPLPHYITVNVGASYNLTGFKALPRPEVAGVGSSANGRIGQYEFYVSTDGLAFGPAQLAASGTFPDTAAEQTVSFMGRTGQYVRLRALTEAGNRGPWTSLAELTVLQTPTGSGALAGTTTRAAVAGAASFPGLSVNQAGSYVLQASSGTLPIISAPFTIVAPTIPVQVPSVIRFGR